MSGTLPKARRQSIVFINDGRSKRTYRIALNATNGSALLLETLPRQGGTVRDTRTSLYKARLRQWQTRSLAVGLLLGSLRVAFPLKTISSLVIAMVRSSSLLGSLALLASAVTAKEMPVNASKAVKLYESGKVHETIMARKKVAIFLRVSATASEANVLSG